MSGGVSAHNRRYEKNKRSVDCLKYSLFIFNFLFLVTGCVIFAIGIWTLSSHYYYFLAVASSSFAWTAYLLIVAGALVIISSILGCVAIIRSDRCFLLVYTFIVLLVFLLELIAAILAAVYADQLRAELDRTLVSVFNENYGRDDRLTESIDVLQANYKCCGATIFSDWRFSFWKNMEVAKNMSVPDTCCKTISLGCGFRDHPSNIWYTGCLHRIEYELRPHLQLMGGISFLVCLFQIIGLILSCRLYTKLKDIEDY